jgi:uncharacterized membrane protein YhhN
MNNSRLFAFSAVSVVYLAAKAIQHQALVFIVKPLLMPLLAWWLAHETRHHPNRFLRKAVLSGLAFATVGDTLLLFTGRQSGALFFMLGLVAFLFTHLFYIGGFLSEKALKNGFLRRQPGLVLPFAIFLGFILWQLWPGIPAGMKLPVSIYASVITAMSLSVVNLKNSIPAPVFRSLLSGALLFMLSDSLIALHKFGEGFPESGIAIMVTYIAGQFLIARSVRDMLTANS